jgi:hypothetical protein
MKSALIAFAILMAAWSGRASGAVLYLEEFNVNAAGWGDRDSGEMSVSYDGTNDRMVGSFASSFLPMSDAFRITSGNFMGNYVTPGLTQISFDLVAANVLPSDLMIRIFSGSDLFTYQFNPVSLSDTYLVNLSWSAGWNGLDEAAFNAALTSVTALEIQIARNGSGAQSYYLDNVQTLHTDLGGGGGGSAVPEPNMVSMFVLAVAVFSGLRRYTVN